MENSNYTHDFRQVLALNDVMLFKHNIVYHLWMYYQLISTEVNYLY